MFKKTKLLFLLNLKIKKNEKTKASSGTKSVHEQKENRNKFK